MDYKSIYLKPNSTAKINIGTRYQANIPDFIKPQSNIVTKKIKNVKENESTKNDEITLNLKESN